MEIYKKMAEASALIGAVGKNDHNKAQNFKFRGVDSVYNEVHAALAKCGIFCSPKIVRFVREKEFSTQKGASGWHLILEIEYTFYASDGSSVTATTWGEGIDYGDKCVNKCMSIAHKYALLQVFTIPTEDLIDPDAESHEAPPLTDQKMNEMVAFFASYGISLKQLEGKLKKPLELAKDPDIDELRRMAAALRSGKPVDFSTARERLGGTNEND